MIKIIKKNGNCVVGFWLCTKAVHVVAQAACNLLNQ